MAGEISAADADAASADNLITLADLFPTLGDATPLDHLVSAAATRTWFNFAGFTTWSDISFMGLDEIEGWPGLGRQRVEQLMNDLARTVLASGPEPLAEDAAPEPDIASSSMTFGELFPSIRPAALVENLVTDTRTRNAIGRRGLTTWAQVAPLTVEVVRRWNGIGAGSVQSLLQDLTAYEPDHARAPSTHRPRPNHPSTLPLTAIGASTQQDVTMRSGRTSSIRSQLSRLGSWRRGSRTPLLPRF